MTFQYDILAGHQVSDFVEVRPSMLFGGAALLKPSPSPKHRLRRLEKLQRYPWLQKFPNLVTRHDQGIQNNLHKPAVKTFNHERQTCNLHFEEKC